MKANILIWIFLSTLFLSSCKLTDLRTSSLLESHSSELAEKKGRALLQESVEAMGYDQFNAIQTYEANVHFFWRFPWNMMPMNSFPGSGRNGKKGQKFRFSAGTFDGSIEYLDGKKRGDIHGIQSWKSYEKPANAPLIFKEDKKRSWGLGAWHYLLEAPNRLLNKAPIIRYAGQKTMDDQLYDLVFATWGREEANQEYDQFLLYIHPETKFVDLAVITIRDFYMPMPNSMAFGTVRYQTRELSSSGIWLPKEMEFQMANPKKEGKYVFTVKLSDYEFDSFDKSELSPNESLAPMGDQKAD